MRRFKRFLELPKRMEWLLIESAFLLFIAIVAVPVLPFSTLQAWVTRKSRLKPKKDFSSEEIGWALSTASRLLPRSTCLAEALALQVLLRRSGYDPVIRVGIQKEDGELSAHAWVESEGQVVAAGHDRLEEYSEMSVFFAHK
jgi:hypothetical protein